MIEKSTSVPKKAMMRSKPAQVSPTPTPKQTLALLDMPSLVTLPKISIASSPQAMKVTQPGMMFGTSDFTTFASRGEERRMEGQGIGGKAKLLNHGKGERFAVLLDVSGSMKDDSKRVERFIRRSFPRAGIAKVEGCSFGANSEPLEAIRKYSFRVDVIYFICDLQDGDNPKGLKQLHRYAQNWSDKPVRICIRSFEERGSLDLELAVLQTGGDIVVSKEGFLTW